MMYVRDRIEQRLRERIDELEELLGIDEKSIEPLRLVFGLSKIEGMIASLLMTRQRVTRASMFTVIYGCMPEADQPRANTLAVHLSRVRKKLRAKDITIEKVFQEGWYIKTSDKIKIREWCEREMH